MAGFGCPPRAKEGQHRLFAGFLLERFPERVADRIRDIQIDVKLRHDSSTP